MHCVKNIIFNQTMIKKGDTIMSHKNTKLTWYQLYLRIAKMQLGNAKKQQVFVKNGDNLKPVNIEYDKNGTIAYLVIQD